MVELKNIGNGADSNIIVESQDNSIEVNKVDGGYNIEVGEQIKELINSKQDIINVAGIQSTAIYSMSFDVNYSFDATIGEYIPLLYIESINLGKSQFEFEVFSREDTSLYYGRFIFASFGDNFKFAMLEYVSDPVKNLESLKKDSVVCVPVGYRNWLICKKIEVQYFDFFYCNILMQDTGYCISTKYYSRWGQPYYTDNNYQKFVKINNSISSFLGVNISENAVPAKYVLQQIEDEIGDINTVLESIIG